MINFAPLHIVTGYSFLKSGLTIKKIAVALKEKNFCGAGISDYGVLFGLPEFDKAVRKLDKKPLFGINIIVEGDFLNLYSFNEVGYKNLFLISNQVQREEFSFDFLKEHSEGLVCIIETNNGIFKSKFLELEKIDTTFTKYLGNIAKLFGDNFYLGIEVTTKEENKFANKVRLFAHEYAYDCVAFPTIKYVKKEDAIVLEIVEAIGSGQNITSKKADGQQYFMDYVDYQKIYTKAELDNTVNILNKSDFTLVQKRGEMLHYTNENPDDVLKEKTFNALRDLKLDKDQKYVDQLNYELDIIKTMGYSNYFLLVQDYIVWAKSHNVLVGPGRGSAAGSIVSYLLNISEADPLKYTLQFERFLNLNRKSMPDIDTDFMDIKRDYVIQYLKEKYGINRVANIVTYQTIQAKQAIRDIGRIYKYPEHIITLLSKSITNKKFSLGQAYKYLPDFKKLIDSDEYFKQFISLAGKIEGLPRQDGMHASGVVLNEAPIDESMPVVFDFSGNLITQYEAEALEEQHFLKMDFLALRNLTVVDYCINLINLHNPDAQLDFYKIPFDDPEIFDFIRTGQVKGLFQIETYTMKLGIEKLQPKSFDDVVALLALNRPGPMQFIKTYARRRDGLEKVVYPCKELEPVLKETYGIIVYQEQVNKIVQVMAGFSASDADSFRRAISKKDKNIINSYKDKFVEGSQKLGHDNKTINTVYELILRFADYGFNKSHSVVYAMLTCKMAYLKLHYQLEFYSAVLNIGTSQENKFNEYISEMANKGIKVLPPNVNTSTKAFIINSDSILFPLNIKGFTDIACNAVIEERKNGEYKDFYDFVIRMYNCKVSDAMVRHLIDAGALDSLWSSREQMRQSTLAAYQYAQLCSTTNGKGQLNLGISPLPPPVMAPGKDDPLRNLELEYDSIGLMLSNNPLNYKKELIEAKKCISISDAMDSRDRCKISCIVRSSKVINTKRGKQMAFVKVYDQTEEMEIIVFPSVYEQVSRILDKNNLIVVEGHFEEREKPNNDDNQEETNDEISFICNSLELLEE